MLQATVSTSDDRNVITKTIDLDPETCRYVRVITHHCGGKLVGIDLQPTDTIVDMIDKAARAETLK